jgi:sugar phosphate permease
MDRVLGIRRLDTHCRKCRISTGAESLQEIKTADSPIDGCGVGFAFATDERNRTPDSTRKEPRHFGLRRRVVAFWRPCGQLDGVVADGGGHRGARIMASRVVDIRRDRPGVGFGHANEAERQLTAPVKAAHYRSPWRELIQHPGLWFFNAGSVGLNIGWAFLITWLPAYLQDVHKLDRVTASRYVSIALAFSLGGMLFGGWWCDMLTRRFGQRWGRRLPFLTGSAVCIVAYLLCPLLGSPVAVAVAGGVVAFASDSVGAAVWAISQDIGGRHVASTMAWTNMWGNFGASAVAKVIPFILGTRLHYADWREIFWLCAGGFVLLAVALLFVDSTRSLQVA